MADAEKLGVLKRTGGLPADRARLERAVDSTLNYLRLIGVKYGSDDWLTDPEKQRTIWGLVDEWFFWLTGSRLAHVMPGQTPASVAELYVRRRKVGYKALRDGRAIGSASGGLGVDSGVGAVIVALAAVHDERYLVKVDVITSRVSDFLAAGWSRHPVLLGTYPGGGAQLRELREPWESGATEDWWLEPSGDLLSWIGEVFRTEDDFDEVSTKLRRGRLNVGLGVR